MADTEKQTAEHYEMGQMTPEKSLPEVEKIDTVHQDEALKVLARYAGDKTWTSAEEKRLVRKIDRKLISLLCITYGLQYYDKAMLSQAVSCGCVSVRPIPSDRDRLSLDFERTWL